MCKLEPALLLLFEQVGANHELLCRSLQVSQLLVADRWGFTQSVHQSSITFQIWLYVIFLLYNSFNFIFFNIPPCVCGGSLRNFRVSWTLLLLMFVMALFDHTLFLLEAGPCWLFWNTSPSQLWLDWFYYLLCFNFSCLYKFFGKNTVLLIWSLNWLLIFYLSYFWQRSIYLIVRAIFQVIQLNGELIFLIWWFFLCFFNSFNFL